LRKDQYGGARALDSEGRTLLHNRFEALAFEIQKTSGQLPMLQAELVARYLSTAKDGFPTSSMGSGSRPSTDKDGEPLPTYSDRTGATAVSDPHDDPDGSALLQAWSHLRDADAALRACHGSLLARLRPPAAPEPEETGDPGCRSHRRVRRPGGDGRMFEDTMRDSMCPFCYGWTVSTGAWPSVEILELKRDGKTITEAHHAAAVEAHRAKESAGNL